VRAFARDHQIPWVDFAKGQRKDDVAHEFLAGFTGTEGVLFIGRAQEKTNLFRTRKRRRDDGSSYPWIAAESGVVNHFYLYCVDADFGPFFLKFCSYFPFNAKLCINGNEWAKRQAAKAGIGFTALSKTVSTIRAARSPDVRWQADPDRKAGHGPSTGSRAAAIAPNPNGGSYFGDRLEHQPPLAGKLEERSGVPPRAWLRLGAVSVIRSAQCSHNPAPLTLRAAGPAGAACPDEWFRS
jgi:hypothetical protein